MSGDPMQTLVVNKLTVTFSQNLHFLKRSLSVSDGVVNRFCVTVLPFHSCFWVHAMFIFCSCNRFASVGLCFVTPVISCFLTRAIIFFSFFFFFLCIPVESCGVWHVVRAGSTKPPFHASAWSFIFSDDSMSLIFILVHILSVCLTSVFLISWSCVNLLFTSKIGILPCINSLSVWVVVYWC